MDDCALRLARAEDAGQILGIYAPYVLDTAITFEYEVPSREAFARRVREVSAEYPYIVCLSDGRIVGYAYAHRHMERAAYGWNAELSVYIDRAHHGRGLGKRLYGALLELLTLQNVRNVYGGVTAPNPGSERLHESFGFVKLGTYYGTGYKRGAWHDVMWFEKRIGDTSGEPGAFVPIAAVDAGVVEAVLGRYNAQSV